MNYGKRHKRPDNRPARKRYWATGQLAFKKICNLVWHNKMSIVDAIVFWDKTRKRNRDKLNIPISRIKKHLS